MVGSARKLKEGSLVATVMLEREYLVTLFFQPLDGKYGNVIDFDDGSSAGKNGPFIMWSSFGHINHLGFWIPSHGGKYLISSVGYPLRDWIKIEFLQKRVKNQYIKTITINGKTEHIVKNIIPSTRSSVKVYASAPWYDVPNGYLQNLTIYNNRRRSVIT